MSVCDITESRYCGRTLSTKNWNLEHHGKCSYYVISLYISTNTEKKRATKKQQVVSIMVNKKN